MKPHFNVFRKKMKNLKQKIVKHPRVVLQARGCFLKILCFQILLFRSGIRKMNTNELRSSIIG